MERREKHLSFIRMARRKNCPASLTSVYARESGSGLRVQEGVVGVGFESNLKRGAFSMRTITSVGVLSVAKIMGAIYAVIGLISYAVFWLSNLIVAVSGWRCNIRVAPGARYTGRSGALFHCAWCYICGYGMHVVY